METISVTNTWNLNKKCDVLQNMMKIYLKYLITNSKYFSSAPYPLTT